MLSHQHPHAKDGLLNFQALDHIYMYMPTGKPVRKSVTSLIKAAFDDFDPEAVSQIGLSKWYSDETHKYHPLCKYLLDIQELTRPAAEREICKLWESIGREAAVAGTAVHTELEEYVETGCPAVGSGITRHWPLVLYDKFTQEFYPEMLLKPWRTEFKCCYTVKSPRDGVDVPVVCGTVDLILRDRVGRFWVCDYKTTNPMKKGLLGDNCKSRFRRNPAGVPFEKFSKTDFDKYSAQLAIYCWILRECYGMTIAGSFIIQLHQSMERAHWKQTLEMDEEVATLMRIEAVNALLEYNSEL